MILTGVILWISAMAGALPVQGNSSRLAQDAALAEVGTNDTRISEAGRDGDPGVDAELPGIAYNPHLDEYLVVWQQDSGVIEDIFGRRVNAGTGEVVGTAFQISERPDDGTGIPKAVYNPRQREYLVVWEDSQSVFARRLNGRGRILGPQRRINGFPGALVEREFEIYGQRVRAGNGALLGERGLRISQMGPDGNRFFDALQPAVARNPGSGEYFVIWNGDDDRGQLVDDEVEIYGQRLSAAGNR